MNKNLKILVTVICVLLMIGGGTLLKLKHDEQVSQDEMIKVVKSAEGKQAIQKCLKNLDENAFSSEGVIKNYEVNYQSIKKNPMSGIDVDITINNDQNLNIQLTLMKYEKIKVGGLVVSHKLTEMLDGAQK